MDVITVAELRIHPVKSCRAVSVQEADVVRRGLALDRRWMVVDRAGRFVTQRTRPEMARIAVAVEGSALRLSAPGAQELELPLELEQGSRREVEVWGDRCPAIEHAEGSAWVSALLGGGHHLVFMPDDVERPVEGSGGLVSFADAYPLLLANEASLEELQRRAGMPLSMDRFRPNVVVRGAEPFAEDGWSALYVGPLRFRVAKPCVRCSVTSVDPETAVRGKEPLRTLATFRRDAEGGVTFGVNLVHEAAGTLRVGDAVRPEPS